MRQDFFEFTPRFKLMVAGNHKPVLRNVDRAMRRRMNLIPFTVEIPKLEQDAELPEKLRSERPGILSWAIEGYAEWQRGGLAPPAAVIEATEEYYPERIASLFGSTSAAVNRVCRKRSRQSSMPRGANGASAQASNPGR
jgi:P4 family phage/plasmid primase-like protien